MQVKHNQLLTRAKQPVRAVGQFRLLLIATAGICLLAANIDDANADDASVDALKQEIQELKRQQKEQQQQFERQLQRLEAQIEKKHAPREEQPVAEPATFRTEVVAAPPPSDDPHPKSVKKATGVKLTFGGYIEAAGIYRDKDEATDIGTAFQRIPFGFLPQAHVDELRFSARQSRVQGLAEGDIDPSQYAGPAIRSRWYHCRPWWSERPEHWKDRVALLDGK